MDRRQFLARGAMVGTAAVTAPVLAQVPQVSGRIDFHNHIVPPVYRETLAGAGVTDIGRVPFPAWSVAQLDEQMAVLGIERAILSLSAPGVDFGDEALAVRLARQTNDLLADMRAGDARRYGGFATLPLPHVDRALAELKRLEGSRLEGVVLLTNYRGRYLSDPAFAPMFEELNRRGALIFLHPGLPPGDAGAGLALPPPILEFVFDTTRCVADLIFTGTLDKYPRLDWVLSHLGGALPFLAWRMAMIEHSPRDAYAEFQARGRSVQDYLAKLYFDTAVSAGPAGLAATLEVVAPSQLVFGSDVPFLPFDYARKTADALDAYPRLTPADRAGIAAGNALRLLADRGL